MKYLLFFLVSISAYGQQVLRAGIYQNFKPTESLILDTGSFTFIGLEMKNLGKGVWLDGSKANTINILNSCFTGKGTGTGILSNKGKLKVAESDFSNLKTAILSKVEKEQTLVLVKNTFRDNQTAISLERNKISGTQNATLDFTLKCNQFKLTCAEANANACNTEPLRKGLVIGAGVRVKASDALGTYLNEIGGIDNYISGNQYPNANDWPIKYYPPPFSRTSLPTGGTGLVQVDWERPINWISMENHSSNPPITYRRYLNEFVWNASDENSQIFTLPTGWVKTPGTSTLTGVAYQTTCGDYFTTIDPIFPGRIAVVVDSTQLVTLTLNSIQIEPKLGDAIPNPAQKQTNIECYIPQNEPLVVLQIIELSTGRILHTKALTERGKLKIELDLSRFSAGIYGYQLILEKDKLGAKRFVVIK